MHELPTELQMSLRGWRGSVRLSQDDEAALFDHHHQAYLNHDLELGGSADPFDLRHHESSLILHPTASRRPLQDNLSIPSSYQNPHQQQQQQSSKLYNPPSSNDKTSSSYSSYHHHHRHHHQRKPDDDASSFSSSDSEDPLSPSEIYTLLGIRAPSPPPSSQNPTPNTNKTTTANKRPQHHHHHQKDLESLQHGLYSTMLRKETLTSRHYRLYDTLIITLMILQLVISAIFIVLGSLPHLDSHIAVAALGAVSTLVAGILALMKGQGLPNRLRMERDGLRRVIFETEELYWDARAGRDVDFKDVCRLREKYVGVVDDARRNHPDVWTASPVAVGGKTPAGLRKARMPVAALQVAKL